MLLFYFCTLASGLFIYFCSILKELEFVIRQTHVHELNKNDMKLELTSYHESTSSNPLNPLNVEKKMYCRPCRSVCGPLALKIRHKASSKFSGHKFDKYIAWSFSPEQ